ncbi:MAG: glycine cleavage system protein R [Pseudomonas sp.]
MAVIPPREQFLVISALGTSTELAGLLCRACLESRCNVIGSRLNRHGEYSSLILQVTGGWDGLARLEASLPQLAKRHELHITSTRSNMAEDRPNALPYMVYVSAAYRPNILAELCQFFANQQVTIESITGDTLPAPHTGAGLFNATMTVVLPPDMQISWLRDQFLDFADMLNLDALLEPWRPQHP